MATLEGRQVSWKERIDDYMSIKGVFLAVIVAGTMAATIILVAYAVSTGQVSDQMTGKMRIPSTHSMPGVMVDEKVVGDKFVDNEAKKPVSSWTEHIDSLLAKEENAAQPAPEQPSQQPAPTQPAPTQPAHTPPAPTKPATAQPAPTQQAPTQPAPTQPAPTQPEKIISSTKDVTGKVIGSTKTDLSLSAPIP